MPVHPNRSDEAPVSRVGDRSAVVPLSCRVRARRQEAEWESLFDGKSLGKWKKTEFGGEGDVTIENGEIVMAAGHDMTGITWTGDVPTENFEIEVKARRLSGNDFFCGLTFPVGKTHCSFIAGGWAGAVCGLSTLDGEDASENDTMRIRDFETARWYTVRVRVTVDRIQAWIDDEVFADVKTAGRRIGIRPGSGFVAASRCGLLAHEGRPARSSPSPSRRH